MKDTIQQLEHIIATYTLQLRDISEAALTAKPASGKWSGKELIGHMIDSAQNNIRRFVVVQYDDKPKIVYAQDSWVAAADYQHYPVNELINLWTLLNKHIVILLKNIPAAMAEKEVMTEQLHTIAWLAEDYNKHLLHHLHQVLKLEEVSYP